MQKKYSVAYYPSQNVIEYVKTLKDSFKTKVHKNWYNSCNSVAHITICEFTIDDSQIGNVKLKIFKASDTFTPFLVKLDHFDAFDNAGAFFIAPNEDSKKNLLSVMKKTQDALRIPKMYKSKDPHMSIGRKLTPENLKIASELFTTIAIDFLCESIVLREFDPVKKQFFVIDTFTFNGNTQPELVQGSLF